VHNAIVDRCKWQSSLLGNWECVNVGTQRHTATAAAYLRDDPSARYNFRLQAHFGEHPSNVLARAMLGER
jgi:hypothetical protein